MPAVQVNNTILLAEFQVIIVESIMLVSVTVLAAEAVQVLNVQQQCLEVNQRTLEFIGGLQHNQSHGPISLTATPCVSGTLSSALGHRTRH